MALLDQGSDPNARGGLGWGQQKPPDEDCKQVIAPDKHCAASGFTPLHWAAYCGHVSVIEALMDRGAVVNAVDERGHTPLHVAAIWAQSDACEALIKRGAGSLWFMV